MPDPNNVVVHDHRIVFMAIPKAANTSIKRAFMTALNIKGNPSTAFPDTVDKVQADTLRRSGGYLVFAFVRNPFARLVSCYLDKLHRNYLPTLARVHHLNRNATWFHFAQRVAEIPDNVANQHFRSQCYDLTLGNPDAKYRMVPEYIFNVEALPSAWGAVRNLVRTHTDGKLILPETLTHENRNEPWNAGEYYADPALSSVVHSRFRHDFDVFGYDPTPLALFG